MLCLLSSFPPMLHLRLSVSANFHVMVTRSHLLQLLFSFTAALFPLEKCAKQKILQRLIADKPVEMDANPQGFSDVIVLNNS